MINSLFLVSYTISDQLKTIFANEMGKLTKKLEYFRTKRVIGQAPSFNRPLSSTLCDDESVTGKKNLQSYFFLS